MDADDEGGKPRASAEEAEALSAIRTREDFCGAGADGVWTVRVRVLDDDDEPSFAADGTPMPETLTVRVAPLGRRRARRRSSSSAHRRRAPVRPLRPRCADAVDETHEENQGEDGLRVRRAPSAAGCDEWRAEDGATTPTHGRRGSAGVADVDADAALSTSFRGRCGREDERCAAEAWRRSSRLWPRGRNPLRLRPGDDRGAGGRARRALVHTARPPVKKSTFQAFVCGGFDGRLAGHAVM